MNFGRFIPISFKLSFLILAVLAVATLPIIFESASYLEKVSFDREKQHLVEKVFAKSDAVETLLWGYITMLEDTATRLPQSSRTMKKQLREGFLAVQVWDIGTMQRVASLINTKNLNLIRENKRISSQIKTGRLATRSALTRGSHYIRNIIVAGQPSLLIISPIQKSGSKKVAVGLFKMDQLLHLVTKETGFVVTVLDDEYRTLAHPDEKSFFRPQIFDAVRKAAEPEGKQQKHFGEFTTDVDTEIEAMLAWTRLPQGILVTAQTSTAQARTPILKVKRRSIYLVASVFAIAMALTFFFSSTLTVPLQKLLDLTGQIARGDFSVQAQDSIKSRDEVGQLAEAFDAMALELQKGKKVRQVFEKLHGDDVAEELIGSDLKRGGVRREATVLFCDIRNFTQFSESSPPEEVVTLLNSFFDTMVKIIKSNRGSVDKFLGDGIMAVWGLHSHSPDNPQRATKAALEMRIALKRLNRQRQRQGLPPIDIGMGLHRGPVVVGMVGSEERMEYTIVGDTVNTASRIEAATKVLGTDLLVSQSVISALDDKFIYRPADELTMKGKSAKVQVCEIEGYFDRSSKAVYVRNTAEKKAA